MQYTSNTKVIAYADDLLVLIKSKSILEAENIANTEINKITNWSKNNKIKFNDQKSKLLVITRRRPRTQRDISIYLNNKRLQVSENMRYLGIIIDRKFNFNEHIAHTTQKCIKLIHSLTKSARINWDLKSDVLKIIYKRAILPLLTFAAPIWIDSVKKGINSIKLGRVQKLLNIKLIKAFRTILYEAWCFIAGTIELQRIANYYVVTRENPNILSILYLNKLRKIVSKYH